MKNIKEIINNRENFITFLQESILTEEEIDYIIDQENTSLLNLLLDSDQENLEDHHIRKMIRVYPEEKISKIKDHHKILSFINDVFCKDEKDFKLHTLHHINNVVDISLDILDYILDRPSLKAYYKIQNCTGQFLRNFIYQGMKLHDQAKILEEEEFLEKYDLTEPFYKILYRHYGKGYSKELKSIVEKLNIADGEIIDTYLSNKTDDKNLIYFFKRIEKLADSVDRGCNDVTPEEMRTKKTPPSVYLKNSISDEEMAIIKHMEKVYSLSYRSSLEKK